mgnify:CR=1 FL=1
MKKIYYVLIKYSYECLFATINRSIAYTKIKDIKNGYTKFDPDLDYIVVESTADKDGCFYINLY